MQRIKRVFHMEKTAHSGFGRDTVLVEKVMVPEDSSNPSVRRENHARRAEDDFRGRHPEIFN